MEKELPTLPWKDEPVTENEKRQNSKVMMVLFWAVITHISIATASIVLRTLGLPVASARTVQRWLKEATDHLVEEWINIELQKRFKSLPGGLKGRLRRKGIVIIDFHLAPFYGDEDTPGVRKGKRKASTNKFFGYLTADTWVKGHYVTLAVIPLPPGASYGDAVKRLFALITPFFTPKIVLGDGDFSSHELIAFYESLGVNYCLRFKIYHNRQWLLEGEENRLLRRKIGRSKEFTFDAAGELPSITVRCIPYRKQDENRMLVTNRHSHFSSKQAIKLYHHRFAIETGYRDKNKFLIPTASTEWRVRLFLFAYAILLWNTWRVLRWHQANDPCLHERYILERYFTLKVIFQMVALIWLFQALKRHELDFSEVMARYC